MENDQKGKRFLSAITTRLFRCHGLARRAPVLDRWGPHDCFLWVLGALLGAGWYFHLYLPERIQNETLRKRTESLREGLYQDQVELRRLEREIEALNHDDPLAWERAARKKLGWVRQGEIRDLEAWRCEELAAGRPDPLVPPPSEEDALPGALRPPQAGGSLLASMPGGPRSSLPSGRGAPAAPRRPAPSAVAQGNAGGTRGIRTPVASRAAPAPAE